MGDVATITLNIAKSVFQVHGVDVDGMADKPANLYKVVPQNDMAAFASATGMLIEIASMELLSRRPAYRTRNLIERAFCRLKDWRRNAIQYDKPVATFASAIAPAVIVLR